MIFGIKEVRKDLGEFSSELCSACQNSERYHFYRITRYLVIFFIKLIPLGSEYEAVCTVCSDKVPVQTDSGRAIARAHFKKRLFALGFLTWLKLIIAAAIVAAVVALPLTIRIPLDTRPETLKSLITETEDGVYGIQDRDGRVLGIVQIEGGEKKLTHYDDVSVLVKEPGADGSFKMHEFRQEATNDTQTEDIFLVRIPDNPGILEDRNGIPVRIYHYDSANDALGYSRGVEDLTTITYSAGKAVYPYKYYSSDSEEPTSYVLALYFVQNKQLLATFIPKLPTGETNQFVSLSVEEMKDGRVQTDTQYVFDTNMVTQARQAGLTEQSSAQDILSFLEVNKPKPYLVTSNEYFENTKVVINTTLSMPDANDKMQSVSQTFNVTPRNGYYIVSAAKQDE